MVWAGMRGAVTVAAAQTLPLGGAGPAQRSLLVLIAFSVAAISLLLQGGTLFHLIRWLKPLTDNPTALAEERGKVLQLVRNVTDSVCPEPGESNKEHRLKQLGASRGALLDARDLGVYSTARGFSVAPLRRSTPSRLRLTFGAGRRAELGSVYGRTSFVSASQSTPILTAVRNPALDPVVTTELLRVLFTRFLAPPPPLSPV